MLAPPMRKRATVNKHADKNFLMGFAMEARQEMVA
jgi:hypothetical protein